MVDDIRFCPNRITPFPGKRLASRISGLRGTVLGVGRLGGRVWSLKLDWFVRSTCHLYDSSQAISNMVQDRYSHGMCLLL